MDELAKKMAELADRFGPSVVDATLGAARVEAYSCLTAGIWCLILGGICESISWLFFTKKVKLEEEFIDPMLVVLFFILGVILALVGIWDIIDPWTWAGINHPELWVAKKVMHL